MTMAISSKPTTKVIGAGIPTASDSCSTGPAAGSSTPCKLSKSSSGNNVKLEFTIRGNNRDTKRNPMAKVRLTKGQQWTPRAQQYAAWKSWVVAQLLDATKGSEIYPLVIRNIGTHGKPFTTTQHLRARMTVAIRWCDQTHGDAEGVFGSIADALFKQDKWLQHGAFSYEDDVGPSEVKVEILFENK